MNESTEAFAPILVVLVSALAGTIVVPAAAWLWLNRYKLPPKDAPPVPSYQEETKKLIEFQIEQKLKELTNK